MSGLKKEQIRDVYSAAGVNRWVKDVSTVVFWHREKGRNEEV